jgi:hypothetical protein
MIGRGANVGMAGEAGPACEASHHTPSELATCNKR